MKNLLVILSIVFTFNSFAQNKYANVEFEGPAKIILKSNSPNTPASGKLSSGEIIKIQCDHGACYFLIEYKGKKVLIVNLASQCGFTPQYSELESSFQKNNNLVILGFPANNFGKQEPGNDEEIAEFCQQNYGVQFPMMEKISVKGDDMHPLYQWLTQKSKNGVLDSEVTWNFQKYLIDEKGNLVEMIEPKVKPDDPRIVAWVAK